MSVKTNNIGLIFLGAFVGIGLAVAGYFAGQTLYNSNAAINIAEVKGLAEKRVTADTADWTVRVTLTGNAAEDITTLFDTLKSQQNTIIRLLKDSAFTVDEIDVGIIDYRLDEYRNNANVLVDSRHFLTTHVRLQTGKVDEVAAVRAKVNELISQGYNLDNNEPLYRFTQLNAIKPEMLQEATTNARVAANQFAADAGVKVGGIRSARQGNFSIRDVGEYGDSRTLEKDVRVVTHVEFYLVD